MADRLSRAAAAQYWDRTSISAMDAPKRAAEGKDLGVAGRGGADASIVLLRAG